MHINVRVRMWVRLDKIFSLVEGLINEFMVISKQRQQFGGKIFFGLMKTLMLALLLNLVRRFVCSSIRIMPQSIPDHIICFVG